MPSSSEAQRRYMGMELGKLRSGEKTDVNMTENQLRDFARKPIKRRYLSRSTRRATRRS